MINVEGLTKRFAATTAVDNISFTVNSGDIVGFLGPNGAGKSTTMKMITTYMPPTGGKITVEGFDTVMDSLNVRKLVGYLPENVPFYTEMRVREYIDFRAKLKGVPSADRKNRVTEVLERCGIRNVERRIIGQLSKGYRQRVGLAEAIVNSPKILILDEPTIGLDPHQIRQIRDLIKELGRDRTIILSTHILPEVEIICNRVIIIHRGKIAAMDTMEKLVQKTRDQMTIKLEVRGSLADIQKALEEIPGITSATGQAIETDSINTFTIVAHEDIRELIARKMAEHHWFLRGLGLEENTLEDIFIKITAGEAQVRPEGGLTALTEGKVC
jgi:ABC-2 type transport system ATP-binding protein